MTNLKEITRINLINTLVKDSRNLNVYSFGSYVYGTADKYSDNDFIVVSKDWYDSENINIHVFSVNQFQNLLENMDIQMLECICLPKPFRHKELHRFNLIINKFKLRVSISTITSNSWVKGKKKLTVTRDYDLRLGLKSLFHSLRILDYGIQLGTDGDIVNFKTMNYVLEDIYKLSKDFHYMELWQKIDVRYSEMFRKMSSRFKELCPKDLTQNNKKLKIKSILLDYNVYTEDLLNELINELN